MSFDLSPGGAYLMTDAVPRMGDKVVCAFSLDGQRSYCFFGEVSQHLIDLANHHAGGAHVFAFFRGLERSADTPVKASAP